MATTIGKRSIYVGGSAFDSVLYQEGVALVGTILPGSVVVATATGITQSSAAATVFGQLLLIAERNTLFQQAVDVPWTINENMLVLQPRSGEFYNVLVAAGNNITAPNTALTRTAAGLFAIAVTDGTQDVLAYADEIVNVTADALVRVRIR